MDAVKFLEELKRICKSHQHCADCPILWDTSHDCLLGHPYEWKSENIKKMISIVEKWSAEHPQKTRLQDFLEKFPNAPVDKDGVPYMRPVTLGYCDVKECEWCKQYYFSSCICWSLPLEE